MRPDRSGATSCAAGPLAAQVALAPCTIEGVPGEARGGSYRVCENRETKQGCQIELSIIVLAATTADRRPDPLFTLSGGPGDAPSFNARFFSRAFSDIRKHRDLVLVDLRGTGKSAPLTCPELAKADVSGAFDADLLSIPAVHACRARLPADQPLWHVLRQPCRPGLHAPPSGPLARRHHEGRRATVDGDTRISRARGRRGLEGAGDAMPGRHGLSRRLPGTRRRLQGAA